MSLLENLDLLQELIRHTVEIVRNAEEITQPNKKDGNCRTAQNQVNQEIAVGWDQLYQYECCDANCHTFEMDSPVRKQVHVSFEVENAQQRCS